MTQLRSGGWCDELVTEARRNTLPSDSLSIPWLQGGSVLNYQVHTAGIATGAPSQEAKADRHEQRKER